MTKLSDLLRSAADRAPVGDVSVSTATARQRIRVQRGARGLANGLTGAGAVALILLGVIQPTLATAKDSANGLNLESAGTSPGGSDRIASSGLAPYPGGGWWGECASYPLEAYPAGAGDSVSLAINSDSWVEVEGGTSIDVPTTLTATGDTKVDTTGPEAAILYQGMVVAYLSSAEATQTLDLAAGETTESLLSFPLVNCFDGSMLPAGEYQVLVSQGFTTTDDGTTEPQPEPSTGPSTEPGNEPDTGLSPEPMATTQDASTSTAELLGVPSVAAPEPAVDVMPVYEPPTWDVRVTADPVALTIAGDLVDDPFGHFLYSWEPPAMPDNVLTPEQARLLFSMGLESDPWTMAPGSSRWIMPDYSGPTVMTDSARFAASSPTGWFGCSYDGITGVDFPAQSAQLDLLDVTATVPSRAHVSYGWVVDGNPLVSYSVANTSEYSIPGFYGQPSTQLYLVKDGRVVATAYPVNTDPTGGQIYTTSALKESLAPSATLDTTVASQDDPATYWGLLSPGATVGGQYLWRDVSGCWNESGQTAVQAGTYTVLSMQSVYLQSTVPMLTSGNMGVVPQAGAPVAPDGGTVNSEIAIDPSYPTYDYLELQMWTSLGTVTITTN